MVYFYKTDIIESICHHSLENQPISKTKIVVVYMLALYIVFRNISLSPRAFAIYEGLHLNYLKYWGYLQLKRVQVLSVPLHSNRTSFS